MVGATKKKEEFKVEETDAFLEKQSKEKDEFINKLNADKNDPKLKEYLEVMNSRSKSKTWANDDALEAGQNNKKEEEDTSVQVKYADSDDDLYDDLPPKTTTTEKAVEKDEDGDIEMEEDDKEQSVFEDNNMTAEEPKKSEDPKELIEETGRLFVRNLPYTCSEDDLRALFEEYGAISEIHMPIARDTKKSKGYAYILYLLPEHAIKAYEALDMKTFQGRLLHILPAQEKPPSKEEDILGANGTKLSAVKKEKEKKRRNLAGNDFNWNSLYMSVSTSFVGVSFCLYLLSILGRCYC